MQLVNARGVDAREQPDAAVRGQAHCADILLRRDLIDRDDLRVHAAQHHRDAGGLWAEREHVRVVAELHLRSPLAAHGELAALVDDRHAQRAVFGIPERQHADEVTQQRRFPAAGRRENERAQKPPVSAEELRRNVAPEPDVLAHDAQRERRNVLQIAHLAVAHDGAAAHTEAEPAPQRQKALPQCFDAGIARILRHRAEHLFEVFRRHERRTPVRRGVQLALQCQHRQRVHHAKAQLLDALFLLVRQRQGETFEPVR